MDTTRVAELVSAKFHKLVRSDRNIHNAHLLVHSDAHSLHLNLAAGEERVSYEPSSFKPGEQGRIVHPEQPVFMASVGKLFTAVLVARLHEQGALSFEDPISHYLEPDVLKDLHLFRGRDFSRGIRIKQLLNHTSGLPDYFEDKPTRGKGMIQQLLEEPDRRFQPREILDWSKENLQARFPPGRSFHYSDTGYNLLGQIIEAVTGIPYPIALSRTLFKPLEMDGAFVLQHSQPRAASPYPVAGVYVGDTNIVDYCSMSMAYADGAIAAPLEDLLKFMRALAQGQLLRPDTFARMNDDRARFVPGIDYGYGMMIIRPVPLLMPARYACWGNAGSTGAFMFYHPGLDAYLIGSLNQFRYHAKGIRFMLGVIDILLKNR